MEHQGVRRLGHARALDGIRGIGAVTVITAHYFGFIAGGLYSMEVFFALSGFLITTLLLDERHKTGGIELPAFYRRRAYRLLPALFVVLVAYVLATRASVLGFEQIAAGGLYGTNIVYASGSHFLDGTPFLPFWSLAEEEQFYLLWPLLLLFLLRRNVRESRIVRALVCVVIALAVYRVGLALTGASWERVYYGPDTHSDALLLGCILAFLWRGGMRVPQRVGWLALAALVGGAVVGSETTTAYVILLMAIAATLFVGAALEQGLLSRCLSFRPVVWLGMISYSLYVWHMFVLWSVHWHAVIALPLTLVVATISYYKIERPLRTALRSRRAAVGVKAAPQQEDPGLAWQTRAVKAVEP